MPNKNFIASVLLSVLLMASFLMRDAFSQNCSFPYEMVTKLYSPDPGSYTVWDTLYGTEGSDEEFISVVNEGYEVLAVGEVKSSSSAKISMVFVKFERRGRMKWEKFHSVKGLYKIVKMLPYGDGYIVVGNIHELNNRYGIWIGFFDLNGKLKSQKIISDKKHDLFANDIIASLDKKNWVLALTSAYEFGEEKNKIKRKNASIYLLDRNGNEISKRTYILGVDNEIMGLSVSKHDGEKSGYIATGYFENKNGKKIGWVLRLDKKSAYVWQREFSRGLSANIKLSYEAKNGDILTFGDAKSAASGVMGSWLMRLSSGNGDVAWQRFYYTDKESHNYNAKGLYIGDNGLISVMMMATPIVPPHDIKKDSLINSAASMSYSHVLTVDPRGVTLSGNSYYMGGGVYMSQMVEGVNGRRIMVGSALISSDGKHAEPLDKAEAIKPLMEKDHVDLPNVELSEKAKHGLAMLKNKISKQEPATDNLSNESAISNKDSKKSSRDGWVVVGAPPDAYSDPCAVNPVRFGGK